MSALLKDLTGLRSRVARRYAGQRGSAFPPELCRGRAEFTLEGTAESRLGFVANFAGDFRNASRLTLTPHLPSGWRACEWRGLHVGHTTLDVRVGALPDRVQVRVRRTAGGHLAVTVAPALPPGRRLTDARVDDERLTPRISESMGCRHAAVTLELADEHEIEFWHAKE